MKDLKLIPVHCHPVHHQGELFSDHEGYIGILDDAGIDKIVMWGNHFYGVTDKMIIDFVTKFPDRIIGVPEIVPWDKDVRERMRVFAHDYGMAGIKLHPAIGFQPNDEKLMYPIYQQCMELKLSVACHSCVSGGDRPKASNVTCQSIFWDDVGRDFPELNVVLSHCGWPMIEQTHMLSARKGIALDLTRISPFYYKNVWQDTVGLLLHRFGADRILFGNLGGLAPGERGYDHKKTVENMNVETEATLKLLDALEVDDEARAQIMGGNALRIFRNTGAGRKIVKEK